VNLLQFNRCKPPTRLGHLLLPSSERCFLRKIYYKDSQRMYKYKIL